MSHFGLLGRALALTLALTITCPARGQPPGVPAQPRRLDAASGGSGGAPKSEAVKLTIHAAASPTPALKYQLLPEVRDLKPGNAALLYQRAHSLEWWAQFIRNGDSEKNWALLDMPLAKMPRDKVVLLAGPLREMDLAARREYCDWELTPRLREDGYSLLIPDVQDFRVFGQLLALRARLDILNGRFDLAVTDMQTGFALSRHVGDAPILVSSLVGIAIANITLNQLEDFIQQEKAPNLYWALADLPRPFIDLRRAMQGEKVGIMSMAQEIHAALGDPTHGPVPINTINKYLENLRQVSPHVSGVDFRMFFTYMAARTFPAGKEYLLKNGFSTDQVGAMPVSQVALMYAVALLEEAYEETYKWQGFPYWQARQGIAKARKEFERKMTEQSEATFLARALTPAVDRVLFAKARLERRLAMLQTVEALRLHAAATGSFPTRLEDVQVVPVPIDPITGKSFEYALENNKAVLHGPAPAGEAVSESNAPRYELTLARPAKN